jgi:hypothetical protein
MENQTLDPFVDAMVEMAIRFAMKKILSYRRSNHDGEIHDCSSNESNLHMQIMCSTPTHRGAISLSVQLKIE